MPLFRVTGEVTISCVVDVEAKDAADARRIAKDSAMMSLCHSCSHAQHGVWSTSGELDGTPRIREVIQQ